MIESFLIDIYRYTPVQNIIFGIISSALAFLIAHRANKLYTETNDKRLIIIVAGFVLGGIFEILHSINSYTQGIQFYYIIFMNLSYSGSIFISLYFNKSDSLHKNSKFKKNTLIISLAYFILVILLTNFINIEILEKLIPYASIEVIFAALYFLLAILYFDIRLDYKLKPVSALIIGLGLLSLSELYIINSEYYHSVYRLTIHIANLLALSLILLGIKDLCLKTTPLNSRQNLLIFSSLILLFFYWIMILSGLIIFNIQFPLYFKYYIFLFFIFTVIIQYILSIRVTGPFAKPIKSIKTTFITVILLVITVILALHSFISLYTFKTYTENQIKTNLQLMIQNESNKLYTQIKNVETINQVSANAIKDFNIGSVRSIIQTNFRLNSFIFGSGVFLEPNVYRPGIKYYGLYWYKDKNGNIKFTSSYNTPKYNYFKYDWYTNGFIPGAKAVWSNPYIDIITQIPMMSVTSPIHRNNKIVGVIETDVELLSFQNYVSKIKVGKEGYAFIVSDKGYYISNIDSKRILKDKITEDKNPKIRNIGEKIINANKTGIERIFVNNIDSFIIYNPIGKTKLKMVFVLPASEVYSHIYKRLILNITLLFLSAILFSIIFTLLFSRLLVKPLDNLVETVGKVAKGDLSVRASVKSKDEIALFADSLNYMIENLQNLVNKEKQNMEREALLRKLVEIIRSSLDINETLNIICDEVAKVFNVQRATIVQFPNLDNYKEYIIRREYKISPEIKGITNIEYQRKAAAYLGQKTLQEDQKLFFDNITESDTPDYLKESYKAIGVRSMIGFPIKKGDDKWGTFVLSEYNYYRHWTEDEIQLLETISDQIYLAIKQAESYTAIKEYADREKLIREIINIIRSSLNVEKIIHTFVFDLGKLFGVSRAFYSKYDLQTNVFLTPDEYSEYRASPDVKSYREFGENLEIPYSFFSAMTRSSKEPIIMSDREEFIKKYNLEGTNDATSLKDYNVAATVVVPILYKDNLLGMYVFDYDKPISFTQKDLDFVKIVSDQTAVALYQAELFTATKEYADREALLRRIIEAVRSTMELDEIFSIVANEIIELFKVQRVAIAKIDPYSQVNTLYREYRTNENIKDSSSVPDFELVKEYWTKNLITKAKTVIIDNIPESDTPDYFKRVYNYLGVKSVISVPVKSGDKTWGRITLSEYDYYRKWSEKDINFLETIANQVYTAIRQAELFSTTKTQAERENSLRRIISKIGSSLDINEIKTTFVTEIGKTLNSDLNAFYEINPENNLYLPVDEYSLYRSSPDIKSMVGINLEDYGYGEFYKKKDIETIIPNTKDFVRDYNLSGSPQEQFIKDFDIKSAIVVPITYGEQLFGIFAINFVKDYRNITEDDINFARTLAGQAGITIYQAKLYDKEKQTAERELLLRNIIATIHSTLDINSIKSKIVAEIGKNLDIDICFILLYEPDGDYFYIDKYSEYRSSPDEKTFVGYDTRSASVKYFIETFKQDKEINYSNVEEYIANNNLAGTEEEKFLREFRIKSSYNLPMFYSDQLQGIIILEYTKKYKTLDENTLNFIRTIANQAGITLYQAKLYNKEKQTAERESILRDISNKIRSSLDLEQVKHEIVTQIGTFLKADRVFFADYNFETNKYLVSKEGEYRSSENIASFVDYDFTKASGFIEHVRNIHLQGRDIIFNNLENYLDENNLRGTGIEKFYKEYGYAASAAINIYYGNIFLGDLVITFEHPRDFSNDEIKFLRTLADQFGVAIYQSQLYNKEKQTAEREALLRKVVETIRSSLDIDEILTIICDEVGKLFNVERAVIVDLSNIRSYGDFIVRREYKTSPEVKGLGNTEFDKKTAAYWAEKTFTEKKSIAIDNISTSNTPDYFKETYKALGVKSVLGVSIKKGNNMWGNFVLSEYNYYRHWTEEDIKLLETIADQVYIAIKQAELYTATKEYAEREKTLREIVTIVRSTLDLNEIKRNIVREIGKLFHADRCYFRVFDKKNNIFVSPDVEYLSSPDVGSLINIKPDQEGLRYYLQETEKKEKGFYPVEMNEKLARGTPAEKYLKERNIKADFALPMWETDEEIVYLVLHYVKKQPHITEEDKKLMETIAKQISIAFDQSRLYESVKQTAEKEKLLREIISEIKIFQTFDQAYNYVLEKMAEIFDIDRAIFVEIPTFRYEKPNIKYEYIRNKDLSPMINLQIPTSCQQMFIEISEKFDTVVINDTAEYHAETEEIQQFFKNNNIKSFMASPFVKYNKEVKLFGTLILCSAKPRIWSSKEIELLRSIIESIVTILWEISKFNEINELRNTFILTLAHDLQVPLVGEERALEFLESRPDGQPIGKFKEFISETLKSHKNLFNLLTRLLESYHYESGKKQLKLVENNMKTVINQTVDKLKELAQSKSIKVSVEIEKSLPDFKFGKDEIEQALYYLVENALTYTQSGGQIVIKSYKIKNEIITCISDNGPGIEPEIQERIFKRYQMAQAIERKIGSGLSLYLTKQIVEAHKGRIWYETESGVGTIFCFVLPVSQ